MCKNKLFLIGALLLLIIAFISKGYATEIFLEGTWQIQFAQPNKDFSTTFFDDSDWPTIDIPNKNLLPKNLKEPFLKKSQKIPDENMT